MAKGIQTSNGKAFEYACVDSLHRMLSREQEVIIEASAPLETAKGFFENAADDLKRNIMEAADAATKVIMRLEPQLTYPEGNSPLYLSLQSDAKGQVGDVRDVLCIRTQNGWEVGFSCKHNHHAVKHSRLSGRIDFGKEWFDIPCSYVYFLEVTPIFDELSEIREDSRIRENPILWADIENKAEKYYKPILKAFMDEMVRLDQDNPGLIPGRLIRYLIGRNDFYKIIADDKGRFTRVEAVNINGTLNTRAGEHEPLVKAPLLKLPDRIYHIGYKPGSDNTIQIVCNEGWEISMRIHSASSKVEPSLKFDVNLISLPGSIYAQAEPWERNPEEKRSGEDQQGSQGGQIHRGLRSGACKRGNQKFTTIELFAGAGGLALGVEKAGFETLGLIELDKAAADTLRTNRPHWNVVCDDIANISGQDLEAYFSLKKGELDLLSGGAPCQSFSYAGNRLGLEDARGTLFYHYAKFLNKLKPKMFLFENVKGLKSHDKGRTYKTILDIFQQEGYTIGEDQISVLNAWDYGVPQKRERLITIGIRNDLAEKIHFEFPKPHDYKPVLRDVLLDCPESAGIGYSDYKKSIFELVPPGGYWRDIPKDKAKEYMKSCWDMGGGRTGILRRLSLDEPSLTVLTSPSQKQTDRCHPLEARPFTVRENARCQTFPDEWEFCGSVNSQYKQVGNAVPVNLACEIALKIREGLECL